MVMEMQEINCMNDFFGKKDKKRKLNSLICVNEKKLPKRIDYKSDMSKFTHKLMITLSHFHARIWMKPCAEFHDNIICR